MRAEDDSILNSSSISGVNKSTVGVRNDDDNNKDNVNGGGLRCEKFDGLAAHRRKDRRVPFEGVVRFLRERPF